MTAAMSVTAMGRKEKGLQRLLELELGLLGRMLGFEREREVLRSGGKNVMLPLINKDCKNDRWIRWELAGRYRYSSKGQIEVFTP